MVLLLDSEESSSKSKRDTSSVELRVMGISENDIMNSRKERSRCYV